LKLERVGYTPIFRPLFGLKIYSHEMKEVWGKGGTVKDKAFYVIVQVSKSNS